MFGGSSHELGITAMVGRRHLLLWSRLHTVLENSGFIQWVYDQLLADVLDCFTCGNQLIVLHLYASFRHWRAIVISEIER